VDAVFKLCAAELTCPRSVAAVTANVDDVLAAPTVEGWSLMHCLSGAAIFDAAVESAMKGLTYDTEKVTKKKHICFVVQLNNFHPFQSGAS
jgi:hypothetical protein